MAHLTHKDKVVIRKLVAEYRETLSEENGAYDDPITVYYGAGGMVADGYRATYRRMLDRAATRSPVVARIRDRARREGRVMAYDALAEVEDFAITTRLISGKHSWDMQHEGEQQYNLYSN